MQYFWIICHTIVGDDFTLDKIFLQPHQAIEWGRRKATQNPESTYRLYKQPITRTGKVEYVKELSPFKSKFDWEQFEGERDLTLYK